MTQNKGRKGKISFVLNGREVVFEVEENLTLLDILRDKAGLTATKRGCGKGECGACTVLLDKRPVLSCIYPALFLDGKEVITLEGLNDLKSNILKESFIKKRALQCGYCTPAMITIGFTLLHEKSLDIEYIKKSISGVLCRCGAYNRIAEAIYDAWLEVRDRE